MFRNFLLVLTLFAFILPINRVADAANAFGLGQKPIPTKFLTIDKLNSIHSIALLEVPDPAYYYFGEGSGGASFMFGIIGTIGEGLATIRRQPARLHGHRSGRTRACLAARS